MTRRDTTLDAMLRNFGAAYYHTTHGTAWAADVTRVPESVAEEDRRLGTGLPRRRRHQREEAGARTAQQQRSRGFRVRRESVLPGDAL